MKLNWAVLLAVLLAAPNAADAETQPKRSHVELLLVEDADSEPNWLALNPDEPEPDSAELDPFPIREDAWRDMATLTGLNHGNARAAASAKQFVLPRRYTLRDDGTVSSLSTRIKTSQADGIIFAQRIGPRCYSLQQIDGKLAVVTCVGNDNTVRLLDVPSRESARDLEVSWFVRRSTLRVSVDGEEITAFVFR